MDLLFVVQVIMSKQFQSYKPLSLTMQKRIPPQYLPTLGPGIPSLLGLISHFVIFGTTKFNFFNTNTWRNKEENEEGEAEVEGQKRESSNLHDYDYSKSQQQGKAPKHYGCISAPHTPLSTLHIHTHNRIDSHSKYKTEYNLSYALEPPWVQDAK